MDDYIKREALRDALYDADAITMNGVKILNQFPSSDVEPVKHGRWEPVLEDVWNLPTPVLVGWRCSQCGRTEQEKEPYCNCGAKMDLEESTDE